MASVGQVLDEDVLLLGLDPAKLEHTDLSPAYSGEGKHSNYMFQIKLRLV